MGERTVGIGILGCGNVARVHAEAIRRVPRLKLVSACSRSQDSAAKLAQQFDIPYFTDLEEFFSDTALEAVDICTPSGTHSELGSAAAMMRRHVLVEKPIDVSLEKADALIEACRSAGVWLGVSLQSRYLDAPLALKQAVEGGRLGRIILASAYIKWFRTREYYAAAPWRGTLKLDGGGALINQAIHTVDLLQWIAGPVRSLSAMSGRLLHAQIEGEDTLIATLQFKHGGLGIIEAATSVYPGFKRRIEITGTEGTAILDGDNITLWAVRTGAPNPIPPASDVSDGSSNPMAIDCEGHRRVLEDFAGAILDNRAPAVDGHIGRESLRIVVALYESARSKRPVTIDG